MKSGVVVSSSSQMLCWIIVSSWLLFGHGTSFSFHGANEIFNNHLLSGGQGRNKMTATNKDVFRGKRCPTALWMSSYDSTDNNPNKKKKKKKNKYAQFSKTDQLEVDPLESMIQESEQQLKELENKKKQKKLPKRNNTTKEEERIAMEFPDTKTIDPYDPTTYGYIELGTIVGAHGVKGWVKVSAVTEFPYRLTKPGIRHMKAINRRSPRQIQLVNGRRTTGDEYLVQLEGIVDRDEAQQLRGNVLYARENERPTDLLQDDEYLISDLVGCHIFQSNRQIGIVSGIALAEDMGAPPGLGQDWLEIDLSSPTSIANNPQQQQQPKEYVLIPFVPSIVPSVDLPNKRIVIDPPPGLLDLTYQKQPKVRIKGFLPAKSSYIAPTKKNN